MPTPDRILAGLAAIANSGVVVAVMWHVVIAAALVAIAAGWRPSQRVARVLLAGPLVSVAAFAFAFANPFNGAVFAAGAAGLVVLGGFVRSERVVAGGAPASTIGIASIAFGAFYPHFLDAPPLAYAYSAPVGLIPCPTLALVVGFALLGNGLGARAWTLVLATLGLFYGLFGMLRLGVYLDFGLVVGAGALAVLALRARVVGRPEPALGAR
ncbi:MAG TPA: hypothetical protein VGD80_10060 [Kofleriaceae bacterium]